MQSRPAFWTIVFALLACAFLLGARRFIFPALSDADSYIEPEMDRSVSDIQQQHIDERMHGVFYRKLVEGDTRSKTVALTFDDGPHPSYTPQLLALLKKYNVHATFFVVGKMVERYPWLVRQEAQAGNVIGNHTYDHVNLKKLRPDQVIDELERCNEVIERITGRATRYCRPPGGDYNGTVIQAAATLGLTTVLWTDNSGDYRLKQGFKVTRSKVFHRLGPGGIILFHDGAKDTMQLLPELITTLRAKGYRFVTISEMEHEKREAQARAGSGKHEAG